MLGPDTAPGQQRGAIAAHMVRASLKMKAMRETHRTPKAIRPK
jgi:hypothetical protein